MNEVIQGEEPTGEELFYKKWGWQTLQENIKVQNDVLKIFITLDTAILVAYLGFYDKFSICLWIKILLFALVTTSLLSSIVGIFPKPIKVNLNMPYEIKTYKEKRSRFKSTCLIISIISLILSIFIFFIALFYCC